MTARPKVIVSVRLAYVTLAFFLLTWSSMAGRAFAAGASPLLTESFETTSTTPYRWAFSGDACLTAGGAATLATSIPACGTTAPVDSAGSGALQLTTNGEFHVGAIESRVALNTATGFQIVFTDAAFNARSLPGADGLSVFLADARQAFAVPLTDYWGGKLGYVGLPNGYVGIGFDEYGNFSSSDANGGTADGFPGRVPESVAIRGAFSSGNQYLGGYTGSTGVPQSLPFPLDSPAALTRPANAPTIRITLAPSGVLTVEIDPHDGNGYRTAYSKVLAGVSGQPALPPQVYLGIAAATGGLANTHQISGLTVTPLVAAPSSFVPTQIPNLAAWYDASDPTTLVQQQTGVSTWYDKSGHNNALVQSNTGAMPQTGPNVDGLAALGFSGKQFLIGTNPAFSNNVFNASTLFVVGNAAAATVASSVLSSGLPPGNATPRWELRLFENGYTHFDFNNISVGRVGATEKSVGPALWSAAGSASAEYLRKDGNTLGTSKGPGATVSGSYPLVVGGNAGASRQLSDGYTGAIGEILVFNRYLSAAESQTVEGYLACKWGLQNRLPENHPYRAVCPGATAATPIPTPAPPAAAIPVLPELRSSNGQLALTVTAQADNSGNPHLYYNGIATPPTLRLLPGDILSVTLTNALPVMPVGSAYVNDTNLHFHGLHVSPNAPGDDSIDMLALPGQTLNYQLAIPYNHPPGLYWYHSHAHGEVERQNLSGMSGAIVIDGIAQYVPSVTNMPERVLVVRDAPLPGQALPSADRNQVYAMGWAMTHAAKRYGAALSLSGSRASMTMGPATAVRGSDSRLTTNPYVTVDPKFRHYVKRAASDGHCVTGSPESPVKAWTINGVSKPSIGIRPGEFQFWRLVNAGSDTYLDVSVDNTKMQIVSLDGVPLSSGINTPTTLTVNDYVVPPASRVEFIVEGPPSGTVAYLRTQCFDAGANGPAMPAAVLATIDPTTSLSDQFRHRQRVAPKMVAYHFPYRKPLSSRVHSVVRLPNFTNVGVSRNQTLYYSDQNTINGQAYDPGGPPLFYAQSGTVEQWTIVNNSSQVHTFHIHQIHFLVQAINGVTQTQQFVRDNVNVPAASTAGPGTVTLLMDFTDPRILGTFLLHCHILAHEDGGMMAKILVGTGPPLITSNSSLTFATPAAAAQSVTISGGVQPYSVSGCAKVATGSLFVGTLNVTPVAQGSCFFTITDSNGLVATVAVTVGAGPSAINVSPNTISFTSPSAAAQSASVSGGTSPYSVSGCGGIAKAAINNTDNGVNVSPVATGSCSLTISDSASNTASLAVSVNSASSASGAENITFHHDTGRTGWFNDELTLNTNNVASSSFKLLGTLTPPQGMPAFGKVYAEPLYVQNQTTSDDGHQHNLVIVATSTDQVYAFDEGTGAVHWETNYTNPAAGITQQSYLDTGCDDMNPNIGITGTPVIDRALDRLYVVVPTKENGVFHLRLHALSLVTGADIVPAVEVTATLALATGGTATVNAEYNYNRAALLEANGNIYVGLTSHCDFNSHATHGWMISYSASSLAQTGNILDATSAATTSGVFLGSIWMSGYGPAADAAGNIYFATGNGAYNGANDFAMTALRMPGDLDITKASTFTPFGEAADSQADCDLAAGGVILLPNVSGAHPHLMIVGGKCGAGTAKGGSQGYQKYVLNRDSLGGFQANDAGALWHASTAGPMWGGPATFQDANGTNYIVYGGGQPISTYKLGLNPIQLTTQSAANVGCLECRDAGSQPVVSSNGTAPGTAVVWALKTPTNSGGTITLYAFDALNMSRTLFSGTAGTWTKTPAAAYIAGALVSPTIANGRVYVPTDGAVAVFGLSP
jgi:FtsP/CotA-like multicopper oxidase with cupredoxin domain